MANSTAVQRFLLSAYSPGSEAGLVRAFLWLKRRIEEQGQSGLLVLPEASLLGSALSDALGWRLIQIFKEEGGLPLGGELEMRWLTYDEIAVPAARPLAAIWPERRHLPTLRYWPGQVLVAPGSTDIRSAWHRLTGAGEPDAEDYLAGLRGRDKS